VKLMRIKAGELEFRIHLEESEDGVYVRSGGAYTIACFANMETLAKLDIETLKKLGEAFSGLGILIDDDWYPYYRFRKEEFRELLKRLEERGFTVEIQERDIECS